MDDEQRVPQPHQEWDQHGRCLIGRDPRYMSIDDLRFLGIVDRPLLAVIRAKCIDCCAGNTHEVRRCGDISCANWPYRMASNPLRHKNLSEEQRLAARQRMSALNKAARP